VVPGGVADLVEVVVLAAGAYAALRGSGAPVAALLRTQEHILELHHAGVGEQQGRVVTRHQRAGGDHLVALAAEELEEVPADVVAGLGHRGGRLAESEADERPGPVPYGGKAWSPQSNRRRAPRLAAPGSLPAAPEHLRRALRPTAPPGRLSRRLPPRPARCPLPPPLPARRPRPGPGRSRGAAGTPPICGGGPDRPARPAAPGGRPAPGPGPPSRPRRQPGRRRCRPRPGRAGTVRRGSAQGHSRPRRGHGRRPRRSGGRPGSPGRPGAPPPPRPRAIRNRGPPAGGSGRGGSTPAAPAGPGHAGRDHCCPAPGRRPRPAPQSAAASAASSPITRPGTNFSRSLASRSLATAGLSLSHWRAFSLPWPMRSPL